MDIRDKNVLVFGSGISGIAASRLLLREGADVILYDGNEKLDAETIKENILHDEEHGVTLSGDVKVILGELSKEVMESLVLTVMSPGVPTDLEVVLITVGVVGSDPPRTCMMPCAIATTSAAPIRSFAPSLKEVAISFNLILFSLKITPITPETIPIIKNCVAISGM